MLLVVSLHEEDRGEDGEEHAKVVLKKGQPVTLNVIFNEQQRTVHVQYTVPLIIEIYQLSQPASSESSRT